MSQADAILLPLILLIGLFSYRGFSNPSFFERFKFNVGAILGRRQYDRLISSGLLHADWMHFGINMFVLYSFGPWVLSALGMAGFGMLLLLSILGGNLFALFSQRNRPEYSAIGFSGATSGLVFAYVAFFPTEDLYLIFLPMIPVPAWIMGAAFLVFSYYGMRKQADNIGHEAHIGGAVAGLLFTLLLNPAVVMAHALYLAALCLPIGWIAWESFGKAKLAGNQPWQLYEPGEAEEDVSQAEIDRILDKLNASGIESLNARERRIYNRIFK